MEDEQPNPESPAGGAQRAAAFLLSLDKETSAKVMRGLDPKVVSKIAEAMTDLEPCLLYTSPSPRDRG